MVYEQATRQLPLPRRPGVHQRADRRRDQPRQPQDAVGAARGDGGTPGHRRRRVAPGAAAVLRDRHPEPEGLPGHVPAARRPARPVHDALSLGYTDHNTEVAAARGVQPPPARRVGEPGHRRRPARAGDRRRRPRSSCRAACTTTSSASPPPPARHPDLRLGVSTRGTIALLRTARVPGPPPPSATSSPPTTCRTSRSPCAPTASRSRRRPSCAAPRPSTSSPPCSTRCRCPARARADGDAHQVGVSAAALGGDRPAPRAGLVVALRGAGRDRRRRRRRARGALWSRACRATRRGSCGRSPHHASPRGDPIRTVYRATNRSRRRSPSAIDRRQLRRRRDPSRRCRRSARDDRTEVAGSIPTRRRGVFEVGPRRDRTRRPARPGRRPARERRRRHGARPPAAAHSDRARTARCTPSRTRH